MATIEQERAARKVIEHSSEKDFSTGGLAAGAPDVHWIHAPETITEGKEESLNYLRTMYEIRYFEEQVYDLVSTKQIKGASHLYAGEEAVAVGAVAALGLQDFVASTHRGHGHCGAIGNKHAQTEADRQEHWNKMLAELMGKKTGYCQGRGGSMHIADVQKGNLGATGIVGGNVPVALGSGLAAKQTGSDSVTISFLGDGASNIAMFHESLNFAANYDLPVIYIVENNLYGMSVPFNLRSVPEAPRASRIVDIAERAHAYGMPGRIVDGQDVFAVKAAVSEAVARARRGAGPTLIEAKTYRYYGHSMSDQKLYRTRDEEKQWRERDPILVLRGQLLDQKRATVEEMDAVDQQAAKTIEQALAFAKSSPLPDPADLHDYVYVDKDATVYQQEIDAELALRAKIRPVEDAVRTLSRAAAQDAPSGALPRLKKDQATALETDFGFPIKAYSEALAEAHLEEFARDERVFIMGEDIGMYGGAYAATKGLWDKFGHERVMDTPISEIAIAGAACGAAMRGRRPIAEFQYVDFITLASDQIIHNIAYNRYMFGGKLTVPCVIRSQGGLGRCIAATHSESLEAWFMNIPGLYVVMPSTPYDAKGLLKAAIRDENPVLFFEHKMLYSGVQGPVPAGDYIIPLGVADVKKPGTDVTIVAYSRQVHIALDAAWELEKEGISVEVVDPRTLKPLDVKTLAESVRKTGRLITMSEGFPQCGLAGEIARQITEYEFENGYTGFDYLDAAPVTLAAQDCPIPMSEPLEDASTPQREDILSAVRKLMYRKRGA